MAGYITFWNDASFVFVDNPGFDWCNDSTSMEPPGNRLFYETCPNCTE